MPWPVRRVHRRVYELHWCATCPCAVCPCELQRCCGEVDGEWLHCRFAVAAVLWVRGCHGGSGVRGGEGLGVHKITFSLNEKGTNTRACNEMSCSARLIDASHNLRAKHATLLHLIQVL